MIIGRLVSSSAGSGVVGTGDVVGPSASTDNAIVLWDGTGGTDVKDSVLVVNSTVGSIRNTIGSNASIQIVNSAPNTTLTGPVNVLFGRNAGASLTSGAANVIIGRDSGDSVTTSSGNVIIGDECGGSLTTGVGNNVFIGGLAGASATTMEQSVFIGTSAGKKATNGIAQVMIGESAGLQVTTGQGNVLIGSDAGRSDSTDVGGKGITTGNNNIAIGQNAGATDQGSPKDQTGSDNIAIGTNTDWMANPATNRTVIGNGAQSTADNEIMLGTSAMTTQIPGYLNVDNTATVGGFVTGYRALGDTSTTLVPATDCVLTFAPNGDPRTLTLASATAGQHFFVKNLPGSAETLDFDGGNIDGAAASSYSPIGAGVTIHLLCIGTTDFITLND